MNLYLNMSLKNLLYGNIITEGKPTKSTGKPEKGTSGSSGKPEQGTGGQVVTPPPVKSCPVGNTDEVKKFQDWLDINAAEWATGYPKGKLNKGQGYGVCGNLTKNAWTTYGNTYKSGGNVSGGGGSTPPANINSKLLDFAKDIIFYGKGPGRRIDKFNYQKRGPEFLNDPDIIKILQMAERGSGGFGIQYIRAVEDFSKDNNLPQIGSFDINKKYYTTEYGITKDTLIESVLLLKNSGLINLLLEQSNRVKFDIYIDDLDRKFIGDVINTRKLAINKTCRVTNPLKYRVDLPDEAKLIGIVKNDLEKYMDYTFNDASEDQNVFTKELENKIIEYRIKNKLNFDYKAGNIDTIFLQHLFGEYCTSTDVSSDKVNLETSNEKNLREFGFNEILNTSDNILAQTGGNQELYFNECKYIFNEYPKIARRAIESMRAMGTDAPKITSKNPDLIKIRKAITACSVKDSGKTKGQKFLDFVNVFNRGINSIEKLNCPWRLVGCYESQNNNTQSPIATSPKLTLGTSSVTPNETPQSVATAQTNTSYDNDVNDFKNFLIDSGYEKSEVATAKEITKGTFSADYEDLTYKYKYNNTTKTFELDKNSKPQKTTTKPPTPTSGQTVTSTKTQKDADEPNAFGPNKKIGM